MVRTGNIISPTYFGENRFQKPILYYWLVLLSYKIFGMNWFAARYVAVVFAGLTICITWLTGKALFDRKVATLGAVILMSVPLFFRHAKNAVPDMPLNFFIVWAVYCVIRFMQFPSGSGKAKADGYSLRARYRIFFFVACALGFMIKGFAALVIPVLTVVICSLLAKRPKVLAEMRFGQGILLMGLIICPWFFLMIKLHGHEYLNYMLINETQNRLINSGGSNVLFAVVAAFFSHSLFYLNVIGSYFAPWCIFLVGAIPMAFADMRSADRPAEGLRLMLVWFFVVFFLFSSMYFAINHYMLALSTPFALLLGYFLLKDLNKELLFGKICSFLRKYLLVFIFTAGAVSFAFLFVFLAGAAKWWLGVFLAVYGVTVLKMYKSSKLLTAPLVLGIFMVFVFMQSSLLEKAGITSHAVLQKFAATINHKIQANADGAMIGVGSHDIHEKEFQVYFDQRIVKAAGSEKQETRAKLGEFFRTDKEIYCLITEKDFNDILTDPSFGALDIIQEDYIFRRRLKIDSGFFAAMIKVDQPVVQQYLKEKLVLVRRGPNG
jgi:4-amino-4-deoxy-L-arabinose transferase-like glycosyltransferase